MPETATAGKKSRVVRCHAITAGWASRTPRAPRNFIKTGEAVEWEQKAKSDGPDGFEPLPTWLTATTVAAPKPSEEEPRTLSGLQRSGRGRARKPEGA